MPPTDNIYIIPPDWTCQAVTVPLAETIDWSLKFLGIPEAWLKSEGEGIKVCVLDTGVDLKHEDLEIADAKDFTNSRSGPSDLAGHGSWCIGYIGARANEKGVRGIAPKCTIYSAKVLGDNGSGTDQSIGKGIEWAKSVGADFISLSLGGPRMSDWLRQLFVDFNKPKGKFSFAAAGNDGRPRSVNYPAKWPETIAVAAVDRNGNRARFSSMGPEVDIAAPGVNMLSTIPGGYGESSGTSMATPAAVGVAVLARAKHMKSGGDTPLDDMDEMRAHLKRTAIDKGTPGQDDEYGFGLINPADMLEGGEPLPPIKPEDWKTMFEFDAMDSQYRFQRRGKVEGAAAASPSGSGGGFAGGYG